MDICTVICFFIVIVNNTMKYISRIGQKTGILKKGTKVHTKAIKTARVIECLRVGEKYTLTNVDFVTYQNLNSGRRLIKGLNSSFEAVGRLGPSVCISQIM